MAPTKLGMCLTVTAVPDLPWIRQPSLKLWFSFFPATATFAQGTLEKFNRDFQRILSKHEKRSRDVPWVSDLCSSATPEGLFWVCLEPCWPTNLFCIVAFGSIFLNPGFKKSNTQTPPPLHLQSHIQEHQRTERQKELAVTSLLSMPKPIPHHFPHYCSFMAFKALYFIWDFTFPSSPLDMAHPAASNQEGKSMAGWVFRQHLDLRIARYSHWLLEDLVITGHVGHPIPQHILVHHPVRMDIMGGRKEARVWIDMVIG